MTPTIALILFAVLGLACVIAVLPGLPGTWMLLGLATAIELLDGYWLAPGADPTFGWWALGAGLALALIGEAIEAASGVLGVKAGDGSKRGMVGAFLGGILGALFGTVLIPIPVLGTLLGVLLGTFGGALLGESTGEDKKAMGDAVKPALLATVARIAGTVTKTAIATIVWVGLLAVGIWA